MTTSLTNSPADSYWQYIQQNCPDLAIESLAGLAGNLDAIAWKEPESALELNDFAVMTLIEAEQCQDTSLRAMYLDMAFSTLTTAVEHHPSHPLCAIHLILIRCIIGESNAIDLAFSEVLKQAKFAYGGAQPLPAGLIYLPLSQGGKLANQEQLPPILQATNGYMQALLLSAEVLHRFRLIFYDVGGQRLLSLVTHLFPNSSILHLKLGLAYLINLYREGFVYLNRANHFRPRQPHLLQALYLAYRDTEPATSQFWQQAAQTIAQGQVQASAWTWITLSIDSPFTYIPFDETLLMAVEASLHSIVTIMLLSEGDWFEAEMEFWRNQLRPGMTVIDVGANVGVYTFSAAKRVGPTGRVLAIEPFSTCLQCLQETCRINQLAWVTICAGAASDRIGTGQLFTGRVSELNKVVMPDDSSVSLDDVEEINCFSLDSLIEQEGLTQVDWLKIDAEGHELQVLMGSDRLLTEFAPGIIYENNEGRKQAGNVPVAEFLQSRGYRLFYYQPYIQNLIPICGTNDLVKKLNIIALPPNRLE